MSSLTTLEIAFAMDVVIGELIRDGPFADEPDLTGDPR
jgi:hypothetical protein